MLFGCECKAFNSFIAELFNIMKARPGSALL